jgi:hypothetical protein
MASEWALKQREIRPHPRTSAHRENGWRRHSRQQAKVGRISRRRFLRKVAAQKRALRG